MTEVALRSQGDIVADVKRLAAEFYEATGRPLGVTGEVAEYEAMEKLGLDPVPPRTAGYDALRRVGDRLERIQIKGRRVTDMRRSQRVPSIDIRKEFDSVVLVLLDEHFEPIEMWEARKAEIRRRLMKPGSKSRNERGALAVSQFKSIAAKVWPR